MKNTAVEYANMIRTILPELEAYVESSQRGEGKVLEQPYASDLAEKLQLEHWITQGGLNAENAKSVVSPYLRYSQHMHHPKYIGHQVSSSHLASGVADFIHGAINNPMAIYEMGPSASVVERVIINWMLKKAGWFQNKSIQDFANHPKNGSGVLTHGGSLANLTALLAARAAISPEAWDEGTPSNLVVLGSEVAHYSIARAISIIGMGKNSMVGVPTTKMEVLKADELYKKYKEVNAAGKQVMAVIANACATSTGLYDPLSEIGDFCEEYGVWFHIDGAHGASALISASEKHHLKGIEKADSMIWDTHKMLWTSTLCAAVLFRESSRLDATFQQKGSYLFHEKEKPGFDVMPYAIECTKAGLGNKLFWVLAAEGEKGLAQYVTRQYEKTREFFEFINGLEDFSCPYYPEANILCFRYEGGEDSNAYQLNIRNEIVKKGDFYITSTEVSGTRYLRLTVINALTELRHIEELINEIRLVASE